MSEHRSKYLFLSEFGIRVIKKRILKTGVW